MAISVLDLILDPEFHGPMLDRIGPRATANARFG
jgi:hypothetical protein